MKEVLILQHVASENAGTIQQYLEKSRIPFRYVRLYKNEALPERLDSVRAVIVMGGPMNVYQEKEYPFLKSEDVFIKELVDKNIPYLGICLGAQLLAKALDARVMKAKAPEIGWGDVHLSKNAASDNLFSVIKSSSLRVLQWHEDTFDIPRGAVHLGSGDVVPNQCFSYKTLFYGFQFHIEVNRSMLEDWFKSSKELEKILNEYDNYKEELEKIAWTIYKNFFDLSGEISSSVKVPVS